MLYGVPSGYGEYFLHNTLNCHLQKFSDDTTIVGCVSEGNEQEYRGVITNFNGCECNHLHKFYESVVASALLYAVVCLEGSSLDRDRRRLNKLVRRASSVLDCPLDSLEVVGERMMLA